VSRFFIDRPIFAWVSQSHHDRRRAVDPSALARTIPGHRAAQVSVSATYNGASAKTVEDSVTQVIEQQMKGLDRLRFDVVEQHSSGRAPSRSASAPAPTPTSR
jgi:hypothetical protein